jgi:hypothetical protein
MVRQLLQTEETFLLSVPYGPEWIHHSLRDYGDKLMINYKLVLNLRRANMKASSAYDWTQKEKDAGAPSLFEW